METVTMFRDSLQIWNRSAQAPRSNKSNLRNPDLFDRSDPAKLHPFLTQCYLHFAERQQDFPEDDDKILFIMSYLRGTAQLWFSPNLYDTTAVPTWDGNFPLFIQELTLNFGLHDPVRDAEDRIRMVRMKQATGSRLMSLNSINSRFSLSGVMPPSGTNSMRVSLAGSRTKCSVTLTPTH